MLRERRKQQRPPRQQAPRRVSAKAPPVQIERENARRPTETVTFFFKRRFVTPTYKRFRDAMVLRVGGKGIEETNLLDIIRSDTPILVQLKGGTSNSSWPTTTNVLNPRSNP